MHSKLPLHSFIFGVQSSNLFPSFLFNCSLLDLNLVHMLLLHLTWMPWNACFLKYFCVQLFICTWRVYVFWVNTGILYPTYYPHNMCRWLCAPGATHIKTLLDRDYLLLNTVEPWWFLRNFYKFFLKRKIQKNFLLFGKEITKCPKLATKKNLEWEEPMGRKHIITRVKYRGKNRHRYVQHWSKTSYALTFETFPNILLKTFSAFAFLRRVKA